MKRFSLYSWPVLFLSAILLVVVCVSLRSLWMRGTDLTAGHDHGENLNHTHVHTHDGAQRHDHSHWGIKNVTHAHPHQHGHSHSDSVNVAETNSLTDERKSVLLEVGHVHGEKLQVFWVAPDVQGSKCSLRFFIELDGQLETIETETDSFVGQSFFELKPLEKLVFSKHDDRYVATLCEDAFGHDQTTIVVPALAIAGNTFDLKFQLPSQAGDLP